MEPLDYETVIVKNKTLLTNDPHREMLLFPTDDVAVSARLLFSLQPGPRLNIKTVFPGMGIPMLKIRWSWDHLIFNMGIPILARWHLYIETAPWSLIHVMMLSYQYNQSLCGDKTVIRPSVIRPSYLHKGISYTGKIMSFLSPRWDFIYW